MDDGVVVRLLLVKVFVCEALRDGPELRGSGCSIILGIVGGTVSEGVACVSTLPWRMLNSCCSETAGFPALWYSGNVGGVPVKANCPERKVLLCGSCVVGCGGGGIGFWSVSESSSSGLTL